MRTDRSSRPSSALPCPFQPHIHSDPSCLTPRVVEWPAASAFQVSGLEVHTVSRSVVGAATCGEPFCRFPVEAQLRTKAKILARMAERAVVQDVIPMHDGT